MYKNLSRIQRNSCNVKILHFAIGKQSQVRECSAVLSEFLNVTSHKEALQTRKCCAAVLHSLSCGALFGRTCRTCLNLRLPSLQAITLSAYTYGQFHNISTKSWSVKPLIDTPWLNPGRTLTSWQPKDRRQW